MKPNGKYFVVRGLFLALCAVALLSIPGSAATTHGTFKLPVEARWGKVLLTPGDYEFTLNSSPAGNLLTLRSVDSRWSGMIMATSTSDLKTGAGTKLVLAKSEEGVYVRALCLEDSGLMFNYSMPKAGKTINLAKTKPKATTMASAAGGQ